MERLQTHQLGPQALCALPVFADSLPTSSCLAVHPPTKRRPAGGPLTAPSLACLCICRHWALPGIPSDEQTLL